MIVLVLGGAAIPGFRAEARGSSVSEGLPFEGRLRNAVLLEESDQVRYLGEYRQPGNFWGTRELVQLIERAAAHVSRRLPGSKLSVGELSARSGGHLDGHRSHQSGRDADLGFYMVAGSNPYPPFAFAEFDRHGRGLPPNQMLSFDDERNWELVQRLVTDPDALVQYIFVAETLERRLIRVAERRGARPSIIRRAADAMTQPGHGHPHRNHFHLRIYCHPSDRPRCQDRPPFHSWYR